MTREGTNRSVHALQSADTVQYESSGTVSSDAEDRGSSAERCLTDDDILGYREGNTSEAERARIHHHLDTCLMCRELVDAVIAAGPETSGLSGEDGEFAFRAFKPGTMLADRYRIKRFIGQGGMGEVYEAFDEMLRTRVALKTVLATAGDSTKAIRKLFDEVRNAQRVTHPSVCRINELHTHRDPSGQQPALHFFTMEFIDGERLKLYLRREQATLTVGEIVGIARRLLEGLRAAHAKGVVHLDFKSDNVMLRSERRPVEPVIMDFGLSRALDAESRRRSSERHELAG